MWLHSADHCSIPNEKNAVCTASGLTPRQYENVWDREIMPDYHPMFKVEDNRLVCNGLRKEAKKQAARSESCRRSALAKRTLSERTATAPQSACSPISSPSPASTPATPKETRKGGKAYEIPPELNDPRFLEVWQEWIKHRSEIRKKLTPSASKKQLKKLAGWGLERAINAIEHSIAGGWQGIFEEGSGGGKRRYDVI
jgi:hypothetical protein